jgi:AraC-like DNA-binding protein
MDTISQVAALAATPFSGDERARFFVATRFGDLDCLTATFRRHRYAPHMHDTYVIGCITEGCEGFIARGIQCYAGPQDICFVNPQDVHDGAPYGGGYSYRMSYPSVELMLRVAREVAGRGHVGTPFFPHAVVRDPEAVTLFAAAHRALERGDDRLAGEELLYRAYAHCIARHARLVPQAGGAEPDAVARVKALLSERYAEDLSLKDLAAAARLSPHQLIRAFRRETAMTPHAFLLDRRIRAARARLRRNERPADVAAATGFADQAHLTRVFKARVGVPPGAYRAAFQA